MLRRLAGCAAALALLAPGPLVAVGAAAVAPAAAAAPAPSGSAAPTSPLRRDVRLGHDPVRYDGKRPSVRLTFTGREGRLVEVAHWSGSELYPCVRTTLRRADGRLVTPWATGYWRLPRTGSYTAVLRSCDERDVRIRVQMRGVVVQQADVDGPGTAIGDDRDVTHLLRVPVAPGERLSIRPTKTPRHLVLPDRTTDERIGYGWLAAETPGRTFVAAAPGSTIAVSRALDHTATLDGAAIALANQGVGAREHVVAFTARAGQWIYPELVDATGAVVTDGRSRTDVLGPDGRRVTSEMITLCPGKPAAQQCSHQVAGPWQVPTDGTYQMTVAVVGSPALESFSLRVRAAAVAPALTLDGPPVTYASTTPGQWVVGTYTEGLPGPRWPDGGGVLAVAGNASASLTDWRMSFASGYPGSSDVFVVTSLTPGEPSKLVPEDTYPGPPTAVLAVPPGVEGSLEVRLASQ